MSLRVGEQSPRSEHARIQYRLQILHVSDSKSEVSNTKSNVEAENATYQKNQYFQPNQAQPISYPTPVTSSSNIVKPNVETSISPQTQYVNPALGEAVDYRTSANTTDFNHGTDDHLDSVRADIELARLTPDEGVK